MVFRPVSFSGGTFFVPPFTMSVVKKTSSAKTSETPAEQAEARTPPIARVEFAGVSAAIWPKTVKTAKGNERETHVVSLTRSYKDGEEMKRTSTLYPQHLLPAAQALTNAWESIEAGEMNVEDEDA